MPELSVIHIALLATMAVVGVIVGWVLRGNRSEDEKAAVSAGWQEQIDAQRREGGRLLEQNKGLMEQVSQFQASHTDAKNRAKELSSAVQEAFARRDELQREIKDIRNNLEVAVSERDQLQSDMAARSDTDDIVQRKDARIEKLTQELENWQNRLPPLIERFRARNEDAERLESELRQARDRILELELAQESARTDQTRIEPVTDPDELTDGLDASNDPADDFLVDLAADDDSDDDEDDSGEPATGTHEHRDNLKRIKGVGPAIEKTLNEMGIFRFQQIAEMSEYDIDRVARRLKGFRSRIYREDWIGQARELRDQAIHV
jgi:predicted flap endonuclease-1-like 5' DNA nuclease/peptidoglycan hydrolase CwlO-like protein